jgi:hypothetical protein
MMQVGGGNWSRRSSLRVLCNLKPPFPDDDGVYLPVLDVVDVFHRHHRYLKWFNLHSARSKYPKINIVLKQAHEFRPEGYSGQPIYMGYPTRHVTQSRQHGLTSSTYLHLNLLGKYRPGVRSILPFLACGDCLPVALEAVVPRIFMQCIVRHWRIGYYR